MATSIGQYAPASLPGEPPSLTEKLGRPQATGLQRVGHCWSDPAGLEARLFFACGSSAPGRLWAWRWRSCLACGDPGGAKCAGTRTASAIGVMAPPESFFSYIWRSEGLFGQSFSVAPPVQALRGLPCLGSFSVVWRIRHIEGAPGWGPAL